MDVKESELNAAKAALPQGYSVVEGGLVKEGDLLWNFAYSKWEEVTKPLPFVPGQKRPGARQRTEIGELISQYFAVARKPVSR